MGFKEVIATYRNSIRTAEEKERELGRIKADAIENMEEELMNYISNSEWIVMINDSSPCGYQLFTTDKTFLDFMQYVDDWEDPKKDITLKIGKIIYNACSIRIVPTKDSEKNLDQLQIATDQVEAVTDVYHIKIAKIQDEIDELKGM